MEHNIDVTNSEWLVLDCLWETAPQTVVQLAKALQDKAGWAKSTSLTTIARMEAKGLLRVEQGSKAKLFWPLVEREKATERRTERFLSQIYHNSVSMMMNSIVKSRGLSKDEISDLQEILRQAEEAEQ